MKIKKFKESIDDDDNKQYVFLVPNGSRTYRGSIWDSSSKPWVPYGSELVAEFECTNGRGYMVINQKELDEINKIKEENEIKKNANKYNL